MTNWLVNNRRFLVFLALFAVFRTASLLIGRVHRIAVSGDVARLELRTERVASKL